jgi:uncharacterized repeat protein (TIGR03847 family)
MSQELADFGLPDFFEAEALGQPGQRHFRLIAQKGFRTAALWVERADVEMLIQALGQVVAQLSGTEVLRLIGGQDVPPAPPLRADFPLEPDVEFQVGRWALGVDETNELIVFLATSLEASLEMGETDEIIPQFRVLLTRESAEHFAQAAESVVQAGRPRCPLCGMPLNTPDEPHNCIKHNGHKQIAPAD